MIQRQDRDEQNECHEDDHDEPEEVDGVHDGDERPEKARDIAWGTVAEADVEPVGVAAWAAETEAVRRPRASSGAPRRIRTDCFASTSDDVGPELDHWEHRTASRPRKLFEAEVDRHRGRPSLKRTMNKWSTSPLHFPGEIRDEDGSCYIDNWPVRPPRGLVASVLRGGTGVGSTEVDPFAPRTLVDPLDPSKSGFGGLRAGGNDKTTFRVAGSWPALIDGDVLDDLCDVGDLGDALGGVPWAARSGLGSDRTGLTSFWLNR